MKDSFGVARCLNCQIVIDEMRARGFQYTARQQDSQPWAVAFMRATTKRGTGATLHEAIQAAVED